MPILIKTAGNLVSPVLADRIGAIVRQGYDDLGKSLVQQVQADSPQSFRKSIKHRVTGQGLATQMSVYSDDPDYIYIEKGRRPGKQPPPDVMLAWVRRKGLGASAFSIATRRPLKLGTRRTVNRATGKLRTRSQSLLTMQRSIAFLVGRAIGRQGLPRHTGFKPKHALGLFAGLKVDHAPEIQTAYDRMRDQIASLLNG